MGTTLSADVTVALLREGRVARLTYDYICVLLVFSHVTNRRWEIVGPDQLLRVTVG